MFWSLTRMVVINILSGIILLFCSNVEGATFAGINPGVTTRPEAERVLGKPLTIIKRTMGVQYDGKGKGAKKIVVQYKGETVSSIKLFFTGQIARERLIKSFNLDSPIYSFQKKPRMEHFSPQHISFHYKSGKHQSHISYVELHSPESFKSATARFRTVEAPPLHECDTLASSKYDEKRISSPVDWNDIKTDRAISACRHALSEYPDTARFLFQLGRVLDAAGRKEESFSYYSRAADRKYTASFISLGNCYRNGRGTEKDYNRALTWYRKAADMGDATSQYHVGWFYYKGYSVKENRQEALKWFRKSAEQNYKLGQYEMGRYYHFGIGQDKDYNEAEKWYKLAAAQGHTSSKNNLALVLLKLKRPSEAYSILSELSNTDPDNRTYKVNKGLALLDLGRFREAEFTMRELHKANPDKSSYMVELSRTLAAQKKYRTAFDWLERAVQAGYGNKSFIDKDRYLAYLRKYDSKRFSKIVKKRWAAIAVTEKAGWGRSWNASTKKAAEEKAFNSCENSNKGKCTTTTAFSTCGAMARAKNGKVFVKTGNTVERARNNALDECKKKASNKTSGSKTAACKVITSVCSDGGGRD